MYAYTYDTETGGLLLNTSSLRMSNEPRPVYYQELDTLGFDRFWDYVKDDTYPFMWAEANNYYYRGRLVAKTKGGSVYTAPEIEIIEAPEAEGKKLRFVDIPTMVGKNKDIIEKLAQDTIKKIYNTYVEYKSTIDVFYVSFSGGKDSIVTLDLVQKALPHNEFVVVFGDTGMEFPDTYNVIDDIEEKCKKEGIHFYRATSHIPPADSWAIFGPPSTTIRWCCSVHKTAPQLLKLREIIGKSEFKGMALVGIRKDESLKRRVYSYVSVGAKHNGQYSCNPILEWNSAEIYLYIYSANLILNDAYKKGNVRAGCLVCPMSRDKSDFIRQKCYSNECDIFNNIVRKMSNRELATEQDNKRYIESGGWKIRNNGRDIKGMAEKYTEQIDAKVTLLKIINPSTDWKIWIKTIGKLLVREDGYMVENGKGHVAFQVNGNADGYTVQWANIVDSDSIRLSKLLKQVFRKAAYCTLCRECEADCCFGHLSMSEGVLKIDDKCTHCGNCHKVDTGCLLYKSLLLPKGTGKMSAKSINCYATHAPKIEWIEAFFKLKNDFFDNHSLGSVMIDMFKRFLRDGGLIDNNKVTEFACCIDKIGLSNESAWGLMLINLAYSPEFNWFIKNIKHGDVYTRTRVMSMLQDAGVKDRGAKSITGDYRRILALPFGEKLGLGNIQEINKELLYSRGSWDNPDPRVVLYSLYKFAEACGNYYQFTLSRLLDHDIDADGVSPTEIFGIERDAMQKIVNGLSVNYPEFISASFTLNLENITLNSEKSSKDVLELF